MNFFAAISLYQKKKKKKVVLVQLDMIVSRFGLELDPNSNEL